MSPPLDDGTTAGRDQQFAPGTSPTTSFGAQPDTTTETSVDTTNDVVANHIIGANMAAQDEGSKSILDTASDLVTKAAPLTGVAVFNSFYNTAVEAGNFFGGDFQKATIEDEFGPDSDTTAYYQQHAGAIEGIALAAGSLIPGIGGIKALKLAQAGAFGSAFSKATGLLSGMRDSAIAEAATDVAGNATGNSLFGLTRVNTIKAIAAGVGDQALQGVAYQTATLATMHASPLTDQNTLTDNISDVLDAAKGFGLVGGLVEGAQAFYAIKKGAQALDLNTKAQEAIGSLGLGDLTPGDRVVKLYSTLDQIPTPASRLEKLKYNVTQNVTHREIQKNLIDAADGDEELAGKFKSFLDSGRDSGDITSDTLPDAIGSLTRLGRYNAADVTSQPSDVFYINSKIDPQNLNFFTHDDIMNKTATNAAVDSKAYSLTSPTQLPVLGKSADTISIPSPLAGNQTISAPKYLGALDAYKQGIDIYVDAKGVTHINPDSTTITQVVRPGQNRILTAAEQKAYSTTGNLPVGSKPLEGVGTTLDTTNGKLFSTNPPPVVGDFSKPVLHGNSLRVGADLYPQQAVVESLPDNPLDADARYVWSALRGIKKGDLIGRNDLPVLQTAYRELTAGGNILADKGITNFSDGSTIPTNAADMLDHITQVKQTLYPELLSQGKSADEISRILNSPQAGLAKNFNSTNPADIIEPIENSTGIRHIRLAYDIGNTKDTEGNLLQGMTGVNYRAQMAADTNTNTVANYLAKTIGKTDTSGQAAQPWLSALQYTKGTGEADIAGAGSSFVANANADYGTFAQQSERIGRATSQLSLAGRAYIADTLSAATNAIKRDPVAAAEWGNITAVAHTTGEHWTLPSAQDLASFKLPPNTLVLEGAIKTDTKTGVKTWDSNYLPEGFAQGKVPAAGATSAETTPIDPSKLQNFYTLSQKTSDVLSAHRGLTNDRNILRNGWWQAQGLDKGAYPPDRVYFPPIDGNKYPFMAYVRQREGYALGESGASVITARSAQELQRKIDLLGPQFDAFTKKDIASFKRAQGEYQFDRNFMTNQAKTEMARKGILNNVVPETRVQNLVNDMVDWHFRQNDALLRDHVELYNAPQFAQLDAMGKRWEETGTSKFGAVTPFIQRSATNPYQSYIRIALGLGPRDEYPLWQHAQDKLQAFGDTAFNIARDAFGASRRGLISVEDASKISERYGLGNPYGTALQEMSTKSAYYGGLANQLPESKLLSKFVSTANATLGATIIRLDTFQQLIHAVTLPIMSSLEFSSATADLQKLMMVTVPGTKQLVPGFARTMYNAVRNFTKDDGTLTKMYSGAGLTSDEITTWRNQINELTMPMGKLSDSGWAQKIDNASTYAEKLTGTKFTNKFIHFIAADIGRQIGEASGQTGQDLLDTIGTFTNRVLGNVAAGQRAQIFTGPVGQAVGLFQSYIWNTMQQLLRHIGEGDVKALGMAAGMQSSVFGLSSLPGFQALNQVIADRNPAGEDLYSGSRSLLGPDISNYLLYGSLSGLTGYSFFSRGDLNPRRMTILPTNPMDFPSVSAGIRVYQNLAQLQQNVTSSGGSVPASLLLAAEHNGLSRPLSGLAQLAQGFSSNPNGDLISTNSGLSDLMNISNMSRVLGAKPLDEAVATDALRRSRALQTKDDARLSQLGTATMTSLYGGKDMDPQQMQKVLADYVAAGGNQKGFNNWFLNRVKDANTSSVNRTMEQMGNPRAQMLQSIMGGQPLPDYQNTGSTAVAQKQAMQQQATSPDLAGPSGPGNQ